MVKRYHATEINTNEEASYVSFYDYDWERAKVDRLQAALRQALDMIEETSSERQTRITELRALASMPRAELKKLMGG